MRGSNRLLKRMAAFLLMIIMLAGILPAMVFAVEQRTVRVAVFPLGQFQYFDENGEAAGYNIEYLEKIAQTTYWKYEYVEAANFQDACQQMRDGKIDLIAPVQKRDYLEAEFDYSAYTMATESAAVYTLKDGAYGNTRFENFEAMSQMTFAAVDYESSSFTQKFIDEYTGQNHFQPKNILYFDNMTEVLEALRTGEVDAAVTNILFAADDLTLLGRFSPMASYYIMPKGSNELRTELDNAMTRLLLNEPSYQTELMSRYFGLYGSSQFTYAEQ